MKTHGMRHEKIYRVWDGIKQRCMNKKCSMYINYGARGITMCDEWKNSFETFYKDMGPVPTGFTIERIDNNKGYSMDNCKWATYLEQARNKRNNILYEENGVTKTLPEWCENKGINIKTVYNRIRMGYSVKDAISKKKTDKRHSKYNLVRQASANHHYNK